MSKLRSYQVKVSVHFNFGQSEKNTKDLKKVRSKSLLALATLGFAKCGLFIVPAGVRIYLVKDTVKFMGLERWFSVQQYLL